MKISRRSAYAVYGLRYLARQGLNQRVTIAEIANSAALPEKNLATIFMQLAKLKMVHSVRGMHGGFMLTRPLEQISLLEVVEAVDGPFDTDKCFFHFGACKHPDSFELCNHLRDSQRAVMNVLRRTRISHMMKEEHPGFPREGSRDVVRTIIERQKACATL